MATFSNTVNSSNRFMSWNERATPSRAIVLRRAAGDVAPFQQHAAAIGLVAAGQHIEAGGLAGAVRPHDAGQLAGLEGERDVLQHDAVAEAQMQIVGLEQIATTHLACNAARTPDAPARLARAGVTLAKMPAMPSGLNSTSTTKDRPNHSIQPVVSAPITSRARKNAHGADHRPPERHQAAADQRHHHDVARIVQAHDVGERRGLRHGEQAAGQAGQAGRDAPGSAAL